MNSSKTRRIMWNYRSNSTAIFLLSLLLVSPGCESRSNSSSNQNVIPPDVQPLTNLTASQQQQKEIAFAARDKLFQSLLGELMNSMGEKGPARSIGVCKTRAPELAQSVSEEFGVRIGRTSFKLRNDSNRPPDWAAGFISDHVEEPVEVKLPDGELGMLTPIRLQATCTICHGSQKQISPEVRAAIVSNYPDDQATGFAEGDLRGYFWVEVPSRKH